ncbi:MAG: alpha-amylase family glycosyl hydrolase [Bacteroidetes bacterium]|nr:alpha-amylase family glycosyl hydrolase [Bacteroidota bacterium]
MKRFLIYLLSFFLCIFIFRTVSGQTIITIPVYPTDIDSCTVIFDASKGNAGLFNVSPPIYAHTGVITNLSTSPSDWKYVIAGWSENTAKARMTSLGNNLYSIKMLPDIRAFYGVPAAESILKMAFVFRNSDGSKTGREANGGDIFTNVYPTITSVKINLPQNKNLFLSALDTIPVNATSPLADTMKIFLNGTLIKTIAGHEITDTILANNFGHNWVKRWVKFLAKNDTAAAADSFCYTVIPSPSIAALPAGIKEGINYMDSATVILCLYAPQKNSCFAIGDFSNWEQDSLNYMFKTPDGNNFWIQLNNLMPRKEYIFQYLVNGTLRIGDPFADKVSDPNDQYIAPETYPDLIPYPSGKTTGIATVFQTAQTQYPWASASFTPPAVTDLVIYELLIRDFTTGHTFLSLIDTLNYLKNLGVNAIELMPVMEFEGNISWGYNPDYSFAVDKYYGPKNTLKQFIETAHSNGIAVILDIVCNHHFGSSPLVQLYWDEQNQRPAANSPWFNPIPKHPYNVGMDFNHDLPATRSYMLRLVKYWLQEYHADGYRFDMSKGFTQVNSYPNNVSLWGQYDQNRINILNTYADTVWSVNPKAYMILEHFADNSEEKILANAGMMPWGNGNNNYNNASGGWVSGSSSDLNWGSYKNRGWSQPNLVWYMESHDEERQMYKDYSAGNSSKPPYNPKDTATALQRGALCANFFFSIPGPKMIWQFGELGYDYSINYPTGTSASRLDPKPIRWDYYSQWGRKYLYNVYSTLIELKKSLPVFRSSSFTVDASAQTKRVSLTDPSMDALVLGNFDVSSRNVIPDFTRTGTWYEFYTGDSLTVTDVATPLAFIPGEYRLYTTVRLPKPVFTGIDNPAASSQAGLRIKVFPNPSYGPLHFELLPENKVDVKLAVYDFSGRLAGTVFEGRLTQGVHDFLWEPGIQLKAGMYFYKLITPGGSSGGKIIIL